MCVNWVHRACRVNGAYRVCDVNRIYGRLVNMAYRVNLINRVKKVNRVHMAHRPQTPNPFIGLAVFHLGAFPNPKPLNPKPWGWPCKKRVRSGADSGVDALSRALGDVRLSVYRVRV